MKWIVIAIVAFIAVYTAITLSFRKPGRAYQPYQDAKDKAVVQRLESAGFSRISANAERPADQRNAGLTVSSAPAVVTDSLGGLPSELRETLLDQPRLAQAFGQVNAPAEANRLLPYTIQFACASADNKQLLSNTYAYAREQEIVIVPEFEKIEGELLARTRETAVTLTIPGGTLQPGTYQVTLAGERGSKRWALVVH